MQKSILFLCIGLFALSCHKDGSNNGSGASSNDYLSSVTSSSPKTRYVDSFSYDDSHRLTAFAQYVYDTSSGYSVSYSSRISFTLPGSGATPSAYTYSDDQVTADPHKLFYDAQGRIIKDTSLSGSKFVTYYSYPGSNIAITVLFDGTPMNNQIDTLFLGNGNINAQHTYYPNDAMTADSLAGSLKFGYNQIANPAYHADISSAIGPLLHILQSDGYSDFVDPISQKALNSVAGMAEGLPANSAFSYNLNTDSKGRLSLVTSNAPGAAGSMILYRYY
jgi:hypothetical protein